MQSRRMREKEFASENISLAFNTRSSAKVGTGTRFSVLALS